MASEIERPKVALIGRPNVGKSTLYNRLIGRRARRRGGAAIVDKLPGVTRDRLYGVCEWDGYELTVIDCGGIGPESEDPLKAAVADIARQAMVEADLVVFITDVQTGMTLSDDEVLKELRRLKQPVIVAVNKVDHEKHEAEAYSFYKLGYSDVVFISALSGRESGTLLDLMVSKLDWSRWPEATPAYAAKRYGGEEEKEDPRRRRGTQRVLAVSSEQGEAEDYPFAWAELGETRFTPDESWREATVQLVFVGRQNVGKSSLTNALLKQHRALVTDVPGTTRDSLQAEFEHEGRRYKLLDTAGIKRISRLKEDVDYYSLIRAELSLKGSEVALLTLDAEHGVVEQDRRVAAKIAEAKRAVVVVVNKADLLPAGQAPQQAYLDYVRGELKRLHWAEVVFTSALKSKGLDQLLAAAVQARESFHQRIDNVALRTVMEEAVTMSPPPVVKNRELRFYDFKQIGNCPPAFLIELNEKKIIRQAYQRYLANTIRKHFGFTGTHIDLVFYEKRRRK